MRTMRWVLTAALVGLFLVGCGGGDDGGEGVTDAGGTPIEGDTGGETPEDAAAPADIAAPEDVAAPEVTPADAQPADGEATDATDATDAADADAPHTPQTIVSGPTLHHVGVDRVTVLWETDALGDGRVELLDGETVVATFEAPGRPMDTDWGPLHLPQIAGPLHQAEVTGLAPATLYTYRVVSDDSVAGPYEFVTAPEADGDFRVVVFGDNRTNHDDHRRVVEGIEDAVPDLLINTGDIVGIGGSAVDWQMFFAIEGELLARTPAMFTPGNHEWAMAMPYVRAYTACSPDEFMDGFVRTVDYGPLRVILLNSNAPLVSGEQYEWLEEALAQADADQPPYLCVVMHEPLYTFSSHTPDLDVRAALHPLFAAHGVGAVFTGHNHVYERFVVDGVNYVVTGGGGAPQYGLDSHVVEEEQALRAEARQALHYVVGDVDGEQALFEVVNADNGEVIDSFTLAR